MKKVWYCALIDKSNTRNIKNLNIFMEKKLQSIFKDDFHDIYIIGEQLTEKEFDIQSENYFFFSCSNYSKYVEKLLKCKEISIVLPSTSNPDEVSYEDITSFSEKISQKNQKKIEIGDIVNIKSGFYKNLHGIVLYFEDEYSYISFYLYTTRFIEKLLNTNLLSVGNIFESIKFPIEFDNKKQILQNKMAKNLYAYIQENNIEDKICRRFTGKHKSKIKNNRKSYKSRCNKKQ